MYFCRQIESMSMRKAIVLFLLCIFAVTNLLGQESTVLKLTCAQIEALLLRQNLQLIAEKFNISIADARIAQAKLWDNPNLAISDVNLWHTSSHQEREMEFSIELSQLIQTANKRGKLINLEKISKEMVVQQFEEVLLGLRTELRKSIHEISYLQSYRKALVNQETSLNHLVEYYKKQVKQGNISKMELLRLQSALLELTNEMNDIQTETNAQQKNLKSLLNADPLVTIEIENENFTAKNPEELSLAFLFEQALNHRPDLQLSRLQIKYDEKNLLYEKAMRTPDLNFSINYDRAGGVWEHFIGFGISFDLPVLNRNQGNIKAAKISLEQSRYLNHNQQNIAQHEIAEAFNNYAAQYKFYRKIESDNMLPDLDNMSDNYARSLLNKNISMLEYIDFMDTYKANKQIILTVCKNLAVLFEELQFSIGTTI